MSSRRRLAGSSPAAVAAGVAEAVVDVAEAVEAEDDDRDLAPVLALAVLQRDGEAVEEEGAVGQAGQGVVQGVVEAALLALAQGPAHGLEARGAEEHGVEAARGQTLEAVVEAGGTGDLEARVERPQQTLGGGGVVLDQQNRERLRGHRSSWAGVALLPRSRGSVLT